MKISIVSFPLNTNYEPIRILYSQNVLVSQPVPIQNVGKSLNFSQKLNSQNLPKMLIITTE